MHPALTADADAATVFAAVLPLLLLLLSLLLLLLLSLLLLLFLVSFAAARDNTLWAAVHGVGFYRANRQGSSWKLVIRDELAYSVALDGSSGSMLCGSSSAYWAGGYSHASRGLMAFNGVSWQEMNVGLAWPFATMIRVVRGAKWLISPGQGVMKWQ